MLTKASLLFLLLSVACAAFGQKTVAVILPPGDYAVFGSQGLATATPTDPVKSSGGSVQLSLTSVDDRVYAWDRKTGNLASILAAKAANGWTPKSSDFSHVAQVAIVVQHDDKPVAAAGVQLIDGARTSNLIVDPNSKGTAEFFDVKPGSLKVTVAYKTADQKSQSTTQIFALALNRTDPEPTFTLALSGDVDTAATPPPATATGQPAQSAPAVATNGGSPPPAQSQRANPAGSVVVYLVALILAGTAIYFVMKFMRQNPDALSGKLEQLGVQIPKPGDQDLYSPMPAVPVAQPQPQPVQKIVLDDAAPDPIPVASPSIAVSEPTLVSSGGVPIPLPEGETVVGREPGLGLSLSAETTVSRMHAKLVRVGNEVTLNDMGSTNGTYVNGARLQAPTVLRPGDAVQFGSSQFTYQA